MFFILLVLFVSLLNFTIGKTVNLSNSVLRYDIKNFPMDIHDGSIV